MNVNDTPAERRLTLRYPARCRDCALELARGTAAVWDSVNKTVRCLSCAVPVQRAPKAQRETVAATDFGTAGASAQRMYDAKEARRRTHLRANWWAIALLALIGAGAGGWLGYKSHSSVAFCALVGAFLPVVKLLARPQHIAAWGVGAKGEQQVGRMLDGLRTEGVIAVHDRRVPGRRTNIDHIAISPAGIFVVDTKNVAGKISTGRSGLRVAGRRQDKMIEAVHKQVGAVRDTLADQGVDPATIRGVLCFTTADLPWFRPSPGGVLLHYPRGLRKELRQPGTLTPQQVQRLAEVLARRLPAA